MTRIPIVAPTIVRFSMHHTGPGSRPFDCVYDVSLDETGVSRSTAVGVLVPGVITNYQDKLAAFLHSAYTFTGATWLDIDSLSGVGGFEPAHAGHPVHGADASTLLPPNVCFLVKKSCGHNRAQRNGRTYFPGVAESNADNAGVVIPATATALSTAFSQFLTAINGMTATAFESVAWRVVHVTGHETDTNRPNAWSSSDITAVSCDTRVATQRRRLRG